MKTRWIAPIALAVTLAQAAPPVSDTSAEACKRCHVEIYNQWKGSMHGQSTALKDPIHGAFYRMVVGDPTKEGVKKKGTYPVCLNCHAPAAALDGRTKLDAKPAYAEGVSCIACHTMTRFKGLAGQDGKLRYGVEAYAFSSSTLQAPSGRYYSPTPGKGPARPFHPFPMDGNPMLKTNDACMGCHDQRVNFKGAPLCVTGKEYSQSGAFVTCQSCHMPEVNGVADHSMMGGHSGDMVQRAIVMTMDARPAGDTLKVRISLRNTLPHAFPTGAPFRNFYVKLTAFDAKGNAVWQNFKKHPMKEDPKAMFWYMLGDERGHPVPPPKATQVLADTRLQPNETRVLEYAIPAQGVAMVRAEALYHLMLPPQVKMLDKVLTEALKAPRVAAVAEAWL